MNSIERERRLLEDTYPGREWHRVEDLAKRMKTTGSEVLSLAKMLGVFLIVQGPSGIYLKRKN